MFFGEYRHSLDEKNRLRIPSKLKHLLGTNFVLTKGTNSCVFIFPKKYFEEKFLSKLSNIPTFDIQAQKPLRMFLSSTVEVDEDNQGRTLLPISMKDFANIDKNIVFVGVGERIELWSESEWDKYKGDGHDFDDVMQQLSSFDV